MIERLLSRLYAEYQRQTAGHGTLVARLFTRRGR